MGLAARKLRMAATGEFAPTDIADLELWFDTSDITIDGSNLITAWTDSSGNGNNFVFAGSTGYDIGIGSINTVPAVVRDPTTYNGSCYAPIVNIGTSVTVFLVVEPHASAGQAFDIRDASVGTPLHDDASTSGRRARRRNDAGTLTTATGTGTYTTTVAHVFTYRADTTSIEAFMDGTSVSSASSLTGTVSNLDRFYYMGNANIPNGAYGDLIVYAAALSTADRNAVEDYLQAKWGTA